jgi:hypothetical protein
MKGSCVLFLLILKNKDVHLILAQILTDKRTEQKWKRQAIKYPLLEP